MYIHIYICINVEDWQTWRFSKPKLPWHDSSDASQPSTGRGIRDSGGANNCCAQEILKSGTIRNPKRKGEADIHMYVWMFHADPSRDSSQSDRKDAVPELSRWIFRKVDIIVIHTYWHCTLTIKIELADGKMQYTLCRMCPEGVSKSGAMESRAGHIICRDRDESVLLWRT